ncbi:unnamed protein product [Agarophyton chilense]
MISDILSTGTNSDSDTDCESHSDIARPNARRTTVANSNKGALHYRFRRVHTLLRAQNSPCHVTHSRATTRASLSTLDELPAWVARRAIMCDASLASRPAAMQREAALSPSTAMTSSPPPPPPPPLDGSPVTSPERCSPNMRHGTVRENDVASTVPPRFHTRAVALMPPPPRPHAPATTALPHAAELDLAAASRVHAKSLALPPEIAQPLSSLPCIHTASSSTSSLEHGAAQAHAHDPRLSAALLGEPELLSANLASLPLDGAPGEDATSSMSSASFRPKSSKPPVILVDSHPLAQSHRTFLPKPPAPPFPNTASQSFQPHAHETDSHQLGKQALGLIAASIADANYSTVLSTLAAHQQSHAVALEACSFLQSVCRDERLYFDFCEEGGIEQFISAALLFGKIDSSLCIVFFNAISALSAHRDDRVSHRLRGMGVPSVIIDLLTYYRTHIAVQTAGCECLALVARSSQQSQTAIATLGGPGVVYRAISQNNSTFRDVKLARASLKAVRYIADNNQRAAEYLVEVAALDPVSSTAELFTDDALEQDILDALQAFSFYASGRRSIILSSGMKAIATIMLRNREPRFLVQCCNFIRAVARWNDRECETAVLQSGIAERVVSLMEASNNIAGVEGARLGWYACYACTFLASFGAGSRKRLRRIGAIESTIDVFQRRKEDPKVVHIATDALAELMKNEPEAKELAMEHNIVGCLKDALLFHRRVSRVVKALQLTLEFLAAPEEAVFSSAHASHSHENVKRENSGRILSFRNARKSRSWKTRISFIRARWKKS